MAAFQACGQGPVRQALEVNSDLVELVGTAPLPQHRRRLSREQAVTLRK